MKCSVIVANYNNATLITEALASVEEQTYTNWEVILVDDGSTDRSLAVLEAYLAAVPDQSKYRLVSLPENKGVGNAKKAGVSKSTGDLIFILDADDALAENALEVSVRAHEKHPNASIIYTAHYNCDVSLTPVEIDPNSKQVKNSDLLEDCISHLVSFKRHFYDLTEGFDPYFKLAEDKDLYYKLEEAGETIFINQPLYFYRISDTGISRGFEAFNRSRNYKLTAIENAVRRRQVSGVKLPSKQELNKLLSGIHLLQAEGIIYSQQALGSTFLKHLGLAILYHPFGSIARKLKAAFILSRVKRVVLRKH